MRTDAHAHTHAHKHTDVYTPSTHPHTHTHSKVTLMVTGELVIEMLGDQKLEDGVTKELQSLVVTAGETISTTHNYLISYLTKLS